MRIFARTDRTFFVAIFNSISNYSVVLYNVLYSDYIKTTKVTSQKVTKIKPNKQKVFFSSSFHNLLEYFYS